MRIQNLLNSLTLLTLAKSLAVPNFKRDDEDVEYVDVHVTTTVQNYETQFETVNGMQTVTNIITDASTTTITRYTATVTANIQGTPYTLTTTASTPIDTSQVSIIATSKPEDKAVTTDTPVTEAATTETPEAATTETPEATQDETTTTESPATNSPTTQDAATTSTPSTSATPSTTPTTPATTTEYDNDTNTDGPTITGSVIPTSTGDWIIENIVTTVSSGVCYVDYDYYNINDEETTTITSTIYTTVTQA